MMTVSFKTPPSVDPAKAKLPAQIRVPQELRASKPPEKATMSYVLNDEHNVYFDVGGVSLKRADRTEEVPAGGVKLEHRLKLVTMPRGAPPSKLVVAMEEKIQGQSGPPSFAKLLVTVT